MTHLLHYVIPTMRLLIYALAALDEYVKDMAGHLKKAAL